MKALLARFLLPQHSCVQWLIALTLLCWLAFLIIAFTGDSPLRGIPALRRGVTSSSPIAVSIAPASSKPSHLIVVAGHAAMRLSKLSEASFSDEAWYLLSYQRNQGFPEIISSHVRKGIELLAADGASILVFSGGETRKDVGPTSEAASYFYLAQANGWLPELLAPRVYLEEYARDSLENLMFSVCRFREVTGRYPVHISVVGFDFKQRRFDTEHRLALRYPEANFSYVGLTSPPHKFNQAHAEAGEKLAVAQFEHDLYGCQDQALADKRRLRNPFKRTIPYELACPEMSKLFHWCGPEVIRAEDLPW